ncbi:MAG: alpha/beta fold hydrolase [Sphingobacteriales bacterium]
MIVANSLATNLVPVIITHLPYCKVLFLTGACVMGSKITVPEIVQPNPHFGVTFAPFPTDEALQGFLGTWAVHMEGELKQKCIRMFRDTDPELRTQMGLSIAEADWSDEVANLEQLTYPVAVVYGKDERIIFPNYLNRSSIRMWRDGVILIAGAGHCCQLDQPGELAALISQYAAEVFR